MAKKRLSLIEQVEQDNLAEKSAFNQEGVNSFIKDAVTHQGAEFNDEIKSKIQNTYGYDYERLVDDIGRSNNIPEESIEAYRNDVYTRYGFSKPSDIEAAEMSFVKSPVVADPEGGVEHYKRLEDELALTNAFINNVDTYKQPQQDEQPELTEREKLLESQLVESKPDVTNIPQDQVLKPTDPRTLQLQKKKESLEAALIEQDYFNQPKSEDSYIKDVGQSLEKGAAALNQGLARIPSTIYRIGAIPQNLLSNVPGLEGLEVSKDKNSAVLNFLDENKITDYYDEEAKRLGEKVSEYERSVTSQLKHGDLLGAFQTLGVQAAETIPLTLALVASGGTGAAVESGVGVGAYATSHKLHQLDENNPDLNESVKMFNSLLTGTTEALSESMSLGSIAIGKKLLYNEGAEGLKALAEKSFVKTFNPVVSKIANVSTPMIGEGLTEAAATYSENYVDYISGVKTDANMMDGVMDSFLVGTVAGGVITGPITTYNEIVTNPVARLKVKNNFGAAETSLNDLTNDSYVEAIKNIAINHNNIEDTKAAYSEVLDLFKGNLSVEEAAIGSNYISSSINYQNTSAARRKAIAEEVAPSVGQDGNVTLVQYEGQPHSVRNPQDLGQDGKVIFLTDKEGNVKPVISSKVSNAETKTQEEVIEGTISAQDEQDLAMQAEQQAQEETMALAEEKGLKEGGTVETPKGKQTLVSVNPDGTSTVINDKGEESIVNTDEIEAYKTTEQKAIEKEAEKAEIEGQKVVSEEPLFEGSDIIVTDRANGTGVIQTPEGEQTFENTEERNAMIEALASSELEAAEGTIDDLPPEQAYVQMLETDPEIANEVLEGDIAAMRTQAEASRTQSQETQSRQERVNLLKEAKELEAEALRLEAILADPTTLEAQTEEVIEEPVTIEEQAPAETVEQAPEETYERTPDIIHAEYQQEKDNAPINQLLPWQEVLLTKTVNPDSFIENSDKANVTPAMQRSWFTSKGETNKNLDLIAQEITDETGFEVTEQDIVDFIIDNPTASVRKTTDAMNELQKEYKDVTGESIHKRNEQGTITQEDAGTPFRIAPPEEEVTISDAAKKDLRGKSKIEPLLKELQDEFGVPVKLINSSEQSAGAIEKATRLGLEAIAERTGKPISELSADPQTIATALKIGTPTGYYDPSTGDAVIISDKASAESVSRLKKTYLHEGILHKGLDLIFDAGDVTILGKTYEANVINENGVRQETPGKDKFLLEVFDRLDDKAISDRASVYAKGQDIANLDDKTKMEIAEEVLATVNEEEVLRQPRLQELLDKLYKFIRKIKVLGLTSNQFTKTELMDVLKQHRELVKQQTGKDTTQKTEQVGDADKVRFQAEEQNEVIQSAKKYDSVDDFIEAYENTNFRDMHRAPGDSQSTSTVEERMDEGDDFNLVEVSQGFSIQPDDYFDPRVGARYYGYQDEQGQESYRAIREVMDNINDQVMNTGEVQDMPNITAYRSVPKDVGIDELIDGDWITFSEQYATSHGERRFGENEYELIAESIPANQVWWDGNDINEWGYDTGKTEFLGKSDLRKIWEQANGVKFRITETPEFKNWFGNSQLVDEQGNPIVYYHATGEDFDSFKTQDQEQIFGKGLIFASPDPKWAQEGFMPLDKEKGTSGSVMPLYVKSENPFDYRNEEHLNELFEKVELRDKAKDHIRNGRPMGLEKTKVTDAIKELGYDGLYVTEEGMTNIGVFSPNQVKSATGNVGTFDAKSEDVRFRVADSQQELEDFVKDSKVKETVYHGTKVAFDKFDPNKTMDGMFWFTSNVDDIKSGMAGAVSSDVIMPVKLNLKNPAGWPEYDKLMIQQIIEQGYDGLVLDDYYVAFEPDQILIEPKEDVKFRVEEEREKVETNPSEKQVEAGNYQKGHIQFDGFDVSIENPKGSIRKGTDEKGEDWSAIMDADYGYIKGTVGADKDHLDVFLGDNLESDKVYVVDQVNPNTGAYDESKILMGYNSLADAKKSYLESFEEGWQGLGDITRTTKDGLKEWFKGDTKKPFAPQEDVRFQVQSDDPKVQAMLDKLAKVQELSKTAAKIRGLEQEQLSSIGPERKFLQDKIDLYKEAVEGGKEEAQELIKEVQSAITDYAKKALPLTEAGAREISPILTLIKNAQTPKDVIAAFERIDELAGVTTEKQQRRKYVAKTNRLLKWMTGLKKSGTKRVGKFEYEDTKAFQELKDIDKRVSDLTRITNSNKRTAEEKAEADAKLSQEWDNLNEKADKTALDEAMMKLIELRRLGSKASPALAKIVSEELEAIYSEAKDAKSEADIDAAINRRESKEFVKDFLTTDTALKDKKWFKRALTQANTFTADIMGNWETLMTMIGGQKLRDKTSLMLNEAQMAIGKQETMDNVLNEAKDIYGNKTRRETLNTIHDLSKEEYTLRQPNRKGEEGQGKPMELSKLHLMDIYNATKNEDVAKDYYMSYGDITLAEDGSRDIDAQRDSGKETIDALLNNLSEQDKALADIMQRELDKYYDKLNEIHIKLYNRDLPRVENYWPSTAEREVDIDVMEQFFVDSRHPSSTKERSTHRTPEPRDAFNKFTKHIDEAEWYTNMALPVNDINKTFKDNNVKKLIEDARGENFYKNINEAIANVGLMPPGKQQQSSKLTSWLNPFLNNWVASKIGATPSVPLKQLLSAVNYAENMPTGQWATGFIKTMANPKQSWKEMMEIPYLKTRLGDGYSEAVQRALNGDENVHKSRATNFHTSFKNLMTIGTRYGDIAAIIFGGKPYLDYLMKQEGITEQEAVDKFMQDTLRSQQAPFSSTLSKLQNSKNPFFRAVFAFSNTPSQYMRKLFEANQNLRVQQQQYKAGKISKEELAEAKKKAIKAHTIYGVVNTVTFTLVGSLISAAMRGSDPDDKIWKDIVNQLAQTYIGGLPVIKDLLGKASRVALDMPVYDKSEPFIEGIDEVVEAGIKLSTGQAKNPAKEYEKIGQGVATMLGVPYYNIKKDIKAIPPFRESTFTTTRIKEVDNKLNELKDSKNGFEARMSISLKKSYSKAKSKATRLRKEGKVLQADRIDQLIEDSKLNLRENNYKSLGSELRAFDRELDNIY